MTHEWESARTAGGKGWFGGGGAAPPFRAEEPHPAENTAQTVQTRNFMVDDRNDNRTRKGKNTTRAGPERGARSRALAAPSLPGRTGIPAIRCTGPIPSGWAGQHRRGYSAAAVLAMESRTA